MLSVILAQFDPTLFGLENVMDVLSSLSKESILSSKDVGLEKGHQIQSLSSHRLREGWRYQSG